MSDTARPGITPTTPTGISSSIYKPPQPSSTPTRPSVVLMISSNFGAQSGSSSLRYLKLACRSHNSLINFTLSEAPPGLKSWINTGVLGTDSKKPDKKSFREDSGKPKIRGTANEIKSAPAATLAWASCLAILRDG